MKDIDIENYKITVPASVSKNKKLSVITIPEQFRATIEAMELHKYPEDYFLFSKHERPCEESIAINWFTRRHLAALRVLGISSEHTMYSWKHTGVVRAFEAGINIKDLQNHLRHHSLDMVNNYLKSLGLETSEHLIHAFSEF